MHRFAKNRRFATWAATTSLLVASQGCFDTEHASTHRRPGTGDESGAGGDSGDGATGGKASTGGVGGNSGSGKGGSGKGGSGVSGSSGVSSGGTSDGGSAGAGAAGEGGGGGESGTPDTGGGSGVGGSGVGGSGVGGSGVGGSGVGGSGGVAGAAGGSGGSAGSAGTGGKAAMAAFDGRALLAPCGPNLSGSLRACNHYPSGTTSCPSSGNQVVEQFTTLGDPGTTYDVTVRVRGIVELKYFTGGTRAAPTGTLNTFYTGGAPDLSHEPAFNVYQLSVSAPAAVYTLNSAPSQTEERRESFAIDYQVTFPVRGGASVTLTNSDPNCIANRNCTAPSTPETQCTPMTLAGVTDSRVSPQPYNGQFILIELVQAIAR